MTDPQQAYTEGMRWVDENPDTVRTMRNVGLGTLGAGGAALLAAKYIERAKRERQAEAREAGKKALIGAAITGLTLPGQLSSLRDLSRGYSVAYATPPHLSIFQESANTDNPRVYRYKNSPFAATDVQKIYIPDHLLENVRTHMRDAYSGDFLAKRMHGGLPRELFSEDAAKQMLVDADMDTLFKRLKARPVRAAGLALGLGLTGLNIKRTADETARYLELRADR